MATGRSLLREPQAVPVASYHSSLSERRTGPCGPVGAALQSVLRAATSVDRDLASLHHPQPSAGPSSTRNSQRLSRGRGATPHLPVSREACLPIARGSAGERIGRPTFRQYNQTPMVKRWLVRLELARDDDGSLSDEGIDALTQLLAEGHANPLLTRGDSGTVRVQMTLDARDHMAARSAAEHMLREGASNVWSALRLPPFTIAFVDVTEVPARPNSAAGGAGAA